MQKVNFKRQLALAAAIAGMGIASSAAHAQSVSNSTWLGAGGTGTWTDTANWDTTGNYPFGAGASATFPDNLTANRVVLLGSDITAGSLTFNNNAPNATGKTNTIGVLAGVSPSLTMQATSGNATITVTGVNGTGSATPVNIFSPLILNSDLLVTTPVITGTSAAGALTFRQNPVSGTGGIIKAGPGTLTFADATNTKSYTGATIINDGRFRINNPVGATPNATAYLQINGNAQLNLSAGGTYTFGASSATDIVLNGPGPFNTFDIPQTIPISFGGTIRLDTSCTITNNVNLLSNSSVHVQATSNNVFFTGVVRGGGSLTVNPFSGGLGGSAGTDGNQGTLFLSGANTYSGGTVIDYGKLTAVGATALGATTGPLSVNNRNFTQPSIVAKQVVVTLSSTDPTTTGSLSGVSEEPVEAGSAVPNSTTIDNSGQLFTVNQTTDATYGAVAHTRDTNPLTAGVGDNGPVAPGIITGAGGFSLGALSTAALTLAGTNTYGGPTTVSAVPGSGGALIVASTGAVPGYLSGSLTVNTGAAFGGRIGTDPSGTPSLSSADLDALQTSSTIFNGANKNLAIEVISAAGSATYVTPIADVTGQRGLSKYGGGTLVLSGPSTYTGATVVRGGKISLQNNLTSSSSVSALNGTTFELAAGGGSSRVLRTPAVSVAGTGRIDLQDNKLITSSPVGTWTGSNYTGITGLIKSGRNGGGWGGSGIVTSQTQATTSNLTTIGVATASQVKGIAATATATFAGQTVTGSDTLAMYTYGGDANLDGKINVDDYTRIDFNVPLGSSGWYNGDFNYDGKINVDDYTIIDFNVGIQGAQFPTAGGLSGVSAVPEPASLSLLGLAAASLMGRRRRRN